MPGIDGMELLRRIKKLYPTTEVIIVTAETTLEAAIETLKIGAFDYILKPFNLNELVAAVTKVLEYARLRRKEAIFRETTYLYQLTAEMSKTNFKEDLLKFILDKAANALNADSGSILIYIQERSTLKLMSFFGTEIQDEVEIKMGDKIVGWVAQNRQPLLINDPRTLPQFKQLPIRTNIVSSIIIPFVKHDVLFGVICLNRLKDVTNTQFTQHDLESLETFATHATLILALHHQQKMGSAEE
jgi:putative methionine-R-sulfoxide reductase with GAF domain